jgi:hypothetical protein
MIAHHLSCLLWGFILVKSVPVSMSDFDDFERTGLSEESYTINANLLRETDPLPYSVDLVSQAEKATNQPPSHRDGQVSIATVSLSILAVMSLLVIGSVITIMRRHKKVFLKKPAEWTVRADDSASPDASKLTHLAPECLLEIIQTEYSEFSVKDLEKDTELVQASEDSKKSSLRSKQLKLNKILERRFSLASEEASPAFTESPIEWIQSETFHSSSTGDLHISHFQNQFAPLEIPESVFPKQTRASPEEIRRQSLATFSELTCPTIVVTSSSPTKELGSFTNSSIMSRTAIDANFLAPPGAYLASTRSFRLGWSNSFSTLH